MADNDARNQKEFLDTATLEASIGVNNSVLDAHSVLISKRVVIGKGNVFYPNVVIECIGEGSLDIGDGNTFYPGTFILCSNGTITIGNDNEFGTGGCTIKANMDAAEIHIGSGGRYSDGVSVMGKTLLDNGSQVLGAITVQSCSLEGGGNYTEPDPDKRAAVLKGSGLARGITLQQGQVINHIGNFSHASVEWQRAYHPK
ncbi:MAG: hypothetical protein JWP13_157 [Candidatus Saccharibacteria bacterium]|nr:hypothetical protein [Candidatus Saccharibacteria bacterium]